MSFIKPIVQLSNIQNVQTTFIAHDSPIWKTRLWIYNYEKHLAFMPETTTYNKYAVTLENVIIDFVELLQVSNETFLRNNDKTWMTNPNDNSELWIHFQNHNPPFSFISFRTGIQLSFSYGEPVQLGASKTYPLLLDFPTVEDTSDILTYKKMSFSSGTVSIDNSTGLLDDFTELFGNDMTLLSYNKDHSLEVIRQFFIERYTIGLNTVDLTVKDKRARLTFKAPNTFYTEEEFPDIEEKLINKVIQDAYGHCIGVEGTCVNRDQVHTRFISDDDCDFQDWYRFKFARKITSIEKVYVEMSDQWVEVFPGLGIEDNTDSTSDYAYQNPNPNPIELPYINSAGNEDTIVITETNKENLGQYDNRGMIDIWWRQALRDNPGYWEGRNGDANRVKMTGIFVDLHNPGDIVKDMMLHYGELPYESSYFDQDWNSEMKSEKNIGICLDKSDDIYSWIEKIQNSALMGFQLLVHRNLFTVRQDNPNRDESFNIHWSEIINRSELTPEMNGDNYATYTTINYNKDYADDEYLTMVDKSKRFQILEVYGYEKEYEHESLLVKKEDVEQKGQVVLENFMEVRPIIRNIELEGVRNDIKLFSTGYIDFTVELPRQMKIIQKYMKQRESFGRLRVKVIGCKCDIKLDKTWIDVIQCDKLPSLPNYKLDASNLRLWVDGNSDLWMSNPDGLTDPIRLDEEYNLYFNGILQNNEFYFNETTGDLFFRQRSQA